MTGSSGDTFVTTVAANGATSLVTTDAGGATAHLQITADGTVDIDSAGVLTLDSGAAINIEPASGSAILLDGTISIDAGVVTGATSITSTAFVGGLTGNVTGNASGTALTVTQAAQTAITSVGTLTALTTSGVLDLTGTTDSSDASGDTGILRVEGGASIAKKLYVGTDLDVDGTTNLDAVDIDGNVDMAGTLGVTGIVTLANNLVMADNDKIVLGTGSDLEIYHDASASYIRDVGTGNLLLSSNGAAVILQTSQGEKCVEAVKDGTVNLYHNNAKKLETTAIGVTVTGTAIATTDTDTSNTGNVTLDFAANQNFVLTLTGNTTLVNPTTEQVGQSGFIVFIQDGTGGRTVAHGNQFFTPGNAAVNLSSAAAAVDVVPYIVQAAGRILLGSSQTAFS